MTDSEQALESGSGYYVANPQNIYNLINTTSLVFDLPFGRGRKFGANWNRVYDALLGGWQINTINTANTGTPLDVSYTPGAANDVTGRIPDYRGEAVMRPNVVVNPSGTSDTINHYYGNYTFSIPSTSSPFGNAGRNAFHGPSFWQWTLESTRTSALPSEPACSSAPNSSMC